MGETAGRTRVGDTPHPSARTPGRGWPHPIERPVSRPGKRALRVTLFLAAIPLFAVTGCSGSGNSLNDDDPVVQANSAVPSMSAPAPSTGASREDTATAPDGNDSTAPGEGGCGTVTAASGLRLDVLQSPGVSCPEALGLVTRFQNQLGGRQPAGSDQPASATVDGWLCVSGPPASQGGTTCSLQDQTVFASAATE